ncbi:MAG: hypothetical protein DFNUSKGM_002926, partial [Candidatus Fervidibacter sacchari]
MPRVWTIITPENVPLELELANPLERGVALIIDTLITVAITVPIAIALTALSGTGPVGRIAGLSSLDTPLRFLLLYGFALPLVIVAYHSLLEGLY